MSHDTNLHTHLNQERTELILPHKVVPAVMTMLQDELDDPALISFGGGSVKGSSAARSLLHFKANSRGEL
jgi:hypothetical protein